MQIMMNSILTKHEYYSSEKEIRQVILVPYNNKPQNFKLETRVRSSEIVPYVVEDLPVGKRGMINEIIIGPAAPPRSVYAVEAMLEAKKMNWVKVSQSKIPYRAW